MPTRFGRLLYVLKGPRNGGAPGSEGARPGSCSASLAAEAAGEPTGSPVEPPALVGYLDGTQQPLAQLLELLVGLYMPHLISTAAASWPEQLAQDWAAEAQAFSSALVEASHAQRGSTRLFIPLDELADAAVAARQRHLMQRLEQQLLRWARQLRGLLDQSSLHGGANIGVCAGAGGRATQEEGPVGEVDFWRARTADLGSVREQLEGAGVGRVLRVLEAARSPHLPAFLALRDSIATEAGQAASNLGFLQALEGSCAALAAAAAPALAAVLPPVLDILRMVWTLSPHYNTPELMTGMLRRVSSAVVARCRAGLDVRAILGGRELASAAAALEECCAAAAAWRGLYSGTAARVSAALPARPWAFDAGAIFAHVEAFAQRCRDLQELCAAQRQFACGPQLTGVLGGGSAADVARALGEVQRAFTREMGRCAGGRARWCRALVVACGCAVMAWIQCPVGFTIVIPSRHLIKQCPCGQPSPAGSRPWTTTCWTCGAPGGTATWPPSAQLPATWSRCWATSWAARGGRPPAWPPGWTSSRPLHRSPPVTGCGRRACGPPRLQCVGCTEGTARSARLLACRQPRFQNASARRGGPRYPAAFTPNDPARPTLQQSRGGTHV